MDDSLQIHAPSSVLLVFLRRPSCQRGGRTGGSNVDRRLLLRGHLSGAIEANHSRQLWNLGVIPRVAHAMTPHHLAVLEHELASDLLDVAALDGTGAHLQALQDGGGHAGEHGLADVFGLWTQIERARHAEEVVELARRVGVDGERAARGFDIHGDELGTSTADDGDEGGSREGEESVGSDRVREGAEVLLAVLSQSRQHSDDLDPGERRYAYTTEEMPDKDHEYPRRNTLAGVQSLERSRASIGGKHNQIRDLVQIGLGRDVIVDLEIALEVGGRVEAGRRSTRCIGRLLLGRSWDSGGRSSLFG